jgi:hypothetical protein
MKWRAYINEGISEGRLLPNGSGGIGTLEWWDNADPIGNTVYETSGQFFHPVGGAGATFVRILHSGFGGFPVAGQYAGGLDYLAVSALVDLSAKKGLSMDVDSQDGSILWLTMWTGDDTLVLQKRNTSDLALVTEYALGDCTEAELDAGTYVAYPHCPEFSNSRCYVFGRLQAPQGLADPSHLIQTTDAGTTFSEIETGLGTSVVTCFRANGDADGARTLYAIVSAAAASPYLYSGVESLAQVSQLTDLPSGLVNVDAFATRQDPDTGIVTLAVGSPTAQSVMIVQSDDDGATWSDATLNLPTSGGLTSVVFV